MELPKNVTQIGESDKRCKIYVEDYVVSYIKQLNPVARNKDIAVALYGKRKMENDITYIFIYGAGKVESLQREIKHLSQAQHQEIERVRRKYFSEQEFQGYRLLNGEMVEGFHVYEQGICRYVEGYAQFYEKNESMLSFMLAARLEEAEPEKLNQDKYEAVKRRQEERRGEQQREEQRKEQSKGHPEVYHTVGRGMRKMQAAVAVVFCLLCVAGIAILWDEENRNDLQVVAGNVIAELTEQKLPDMENEGAALSLSGDAEVAQVTEKPVAVTVPSDAASLPTGTATSGTEAPSQAPPSSIPGTEAPSQAPSSSIPATEAPSQAPPSPVPATEPPAPILSPTPVPTTVPVSVQASYIVQKGDTLIGICIREYGTALRVQEICALNDISDPDDVKVGQVILLPAS